VYYIFSLSNFSASVYNLFFGPSIQTYQGLGKAPSAILSRRQGGDPLCCWVRTLISYSGTNGEKEKKRIFKERLRRIKTSSGLQAE
jgi:hypothetical protein